MTIAIFFLPKQLMNIRQISEKRDYKTGNRKQPKKIEAQQKMCIDAPMRHFLSTLDYSRTELQQILDDARTLKKHPHSSALAGKSIALLFFNPSLRTRTTFELGSHQLGMKAIVLEPGKSAWPIEFDDGAVMTGEPEEHVREVARVLSSYVDAIAVRAFPKFIDWNEDRKEDPVPGF